jgi:hypothetical protein
MKTCARKSYGKRHTRTHYHYEKYNNEMKPLASI